MGQLLLLRRSVFFVRTGSGQGCCLINEILSCLQMLKVPGDNQQWGEIFQCQSCGQEKRVLMRITERGQGLAFPCVFVISSVSFHLVFFLLHMSLSFCVTFLQSFSLPHYSFFSRFGPPFWHGHPFSTSSFVSLSNRFAPCIPHPTSAYLLSVLIKIRGHIQVGEIINWPKCWKVFGKDELWQWLLILTDRSSG